MSVIVRTEIVLGLYFQTRVHLQCLEEITWKKKKLLYCGQPYEGGADLTDTYRMYGLLVESGIEDKNPQKSMPQSWVGFIPSTGRSTS